LFCSSTNDGIIGIPFKSNECNRMKFDSSQMVGRLSSTQVLKQVFRSEEICVIVYVVLIVIKLSLSLLQVALINFKNSLQSRLRVLFLKFIRVYFFVTSTFF